MVVIASGAGGDPRRNAEELPFGGRAALMAGGGRGGQAMARARCRGQRSRVSGSIVRRDPGVTRCPGGTVTRRKCSSSSRLANREKRARALSSCRWGIRVQPPSDKGAQARGGTGVYRTARRRRSPVKGGRRPTQGADIVPRSLDT